MLPPFVLLLRCAQDDTTQEDVEHVAAVRQVILE